MTLQIPILNQADLASDIRSTCLHVIGTNKTKTPKAKNLQNLQKPPLDSIVGFVGSWDIHILKMSTLNTQISYVQSLNTPPKRCTLQRALEAISREGKHYELIQQIRSAEQEIQTLRLAGLNEEAATIKRNVKSPLKLKLPGFIFGAICEGGHKAQNIVKRTGIVCIDFDSDAVTTTEQWEVFRDNLINVKNVFYTALSVSGAGVMALLQIAHPERQREHFTQMKDDFSNLLSEFDVKGAKLDTSKGGNPAQLRFLTYDLDAKYKSDFDVYSRIPYSKRNDNICIYRSNFSSPADDVFEYCLARTKSNGFSFTEGNMHSSIFQFCSYLNSFGVNRGDAENYISSHILPLSKIKSNCITDPYIRYSRSFGKYEYVPPRPKQRQSKRPQELKKSYTVALKSHTSDIFDARGYPTDWDEVHPPPEGTPEANDIERIWLCESSPTHETGSISMIADTFDAILDTNVTADEIDAFWMAQDKLNQSKSWRTMSNRNEAV